MGVYIGAVKDDYSAMQGPAPSGFHVPLYTEWQAVYNIWTALGGGSSDGTNFGIALKLPFAGRRSYSSAGVSSQRSNGYYWSSSRYNANYAYYLFFTSAALGPQSSVNRAYGFSVRCFKNSPVVPTSNWTKLYGTSIEAGGIFWSSSDGLISLSSDGITWITIADKNLGATTVWNSGDTLSEANCGKYYQWGNNYGFPRTGAIANQSTTQVDASNYGPGNYYSSDTFIKYNGRWDTTDNGNLRGGVTGAKPTSLKNAYIGEYHQVTYKYLKWNITQLRGSSATVVQMSEFEICNSSGTKMSRPTGTTIISNYTGQSGEGIDKLIDGSTSSKYCATNITLPVTITITLGSDVNFQDYPKYKRYTANDSNERDPISWTIQLSTDGVNWDTVSTVSNANITTSRGALAGTWDITIN